MFLSLVRQRRSIRKFTDKPVEAEKVEGLIEAALRAPTSMGSRPWEFLVVNQRPLLERLASAKANGSAFLKHAPLAVVVCADPHKSGVWIEDAAIAATFLHLAASSMGLGSCWIQIRERMRSEDESAADFVRDTLGIPANLEVEALVAVGYPGEEKPGHDRASLPKDRVHLNRYGDLYRHS